jgi:hypothetical protein
LTNYQRLLSETTAHRVLLCEVTYFDGSTTRVLRRGVEAWTSGRSDNPVDLHFEAGLDSDLNNEVAIDSGDTLGGVAAPEYGVLTFPNRSNEYDGWKVGYSVDGYDVRLLNVGWLEDGTAITYAEAAASPVFVGVGKGRPLVSESKMEIGIKGDLYRLDLPLCTRFYSPMNPHLPGSSSEYIDFGDVLDRSGSFSLEFWIKTEDPSLAGQLVVSKDTGAAGWYIDIGTAGSGAVRFGIREQTPATSDTATGIIRIGQDHHIAVVWDSAAGKRYIYVDRTLLVTTTVSAGVPAGNAASLVVGKGFKGATSRGRVWSSARTLAQVDANMLLPLLGTGVSQETGLAEMLPMEEGRGGVTWGGTLNSAIVGTLTAGVTWTTSTWCGPSLVGKRIPVVVGKALDVQLAPVDPSRNVFGTCWPPPVGVPAVRSNHNDLAGAAYAVDYRGYVTLTAAPTGTISADIQGEVPFGGAVLYDGSTGYASGTVVCPAGSMSIGALILATTTSAAARRIAGWHLFAAGFRSLLLRATGTNRLAFGVENDAGAAFTVEYGPLLQDRWYAGLGVLDVPNLQLRLYLDGALVASSAVTGTFATTQTAFSAGRKSDSSIEFFPGRIDEVTVWGAALGQSDAEALAVAPAVAGATYLRHCWHCDEGSGTTLTNAVSGGPSLTISGTATWTQSRKAPADIIQILASRYSNYGNTSVLFDGVTGYASGSVSCPPGSMSLHCWMIASTSDSTRRRIAGWDASGGAGLRQLEFLSGGVNKVQFRVANDSGTVFSCFITTAMSANAWTSILAVLDLAVGQIILYEDGFFGGAGASTAVTGTFNTVASAFAMGRSSTSAADFFPGGVDAVSVFSSALGAADALSLKNGSVASSFVSLTQAWGCDEGRGRTLTNQAPGGAALTLTGGIMWKPGGSPGGNTITQPGIDYPSTAAFIRQTAADSGWKWDDGSTVRDAADFALRGIHSLLVPDPVTRKLVMKQVQGPTGTPDALADFDNGDIPAKAEIQPANEKFEAPVYRFLVGYAFNNNVMSPDRLAGIVTTLPDRYQFGQNAWRTAPAQNLLLLDTFPQARSLPEAPTDGSEQQPFPTILLNQADALAEAARVLPFYGTTEERDVLELRTSGLGLTVGSEMRATVTTGDGAGRLGMGAPGKSYRVVHARRVNNRVTVTGWRF